MQRRYRTSTHFGFGLSVKTGFLPVQLKFEYSVVITYLYRRQLMYFPYVFGRASELLAIRSSSVNYLSSGLVIPIVEPIVTKPAALVKAIEEIGQRDQKAIVITNPSQGELKGRPGLAWVAAVDAAVTAHASIIPGYLCRAGVITQR